MNLLNVEESKKIIIVKPYLISNVVIGDIYLKHLLGQLAQEHLPVNYFDLVGEEGGMGHRNHYRFFLPAIVTSTTKEGFEYRSLQGLLTPSLEIGRGLVRNKQPLDGIILHLNEQEEFEVFVDRPEIPHIKSNV